MCAQEIFDIFLESFTVKQDGEVTGQSGVVVKMEKGRKAMFLMFRALR